MIERGKSDESNEPKKDPIKKITEGAGQKENLFRDLPTSKEIKKEDPSPLARSIAVRLTKEAKRQEQIFSAKTGTPAQSIERTLPMQIRFVEGLLEKDTGEQVSASTQRARMSTVFSEMKDSAVIEIMKDSIKDPDQVAQFEKLAKSPEQMKKQIKLFKHHIAADIAFSEEIQPDVIADEVDALKHVNKVAEEHNVSPEKLYEDDTLYEELMRKTYSPEQYAGKVVYALDGFTQEDIVKAHIRHAVKIDALREGLEDISEASVNYATNQKMQQMREAPGFAAHEARLDKTFAAFQDGIITHARSQVLRFWGEEALDKLPDTLRSKLGLSDPETNHEKVAESYNHLGLALNKSEQPEKAIAPLTRATQLDPTVPRYWGELGSTHHELENYEAARDAYQHAVNLYDPKRDQLTINIVQGLMNKVSSRINKDQH